MRRYSFLSKQSLLSALNKLSSAFLAAKNEAGIKQILFSVFTPDERTKIGRRIQIACMISDHLTYDTITQELQVGKQTVMSVVRRMDSKPEGFSLILSQEEKHPGHTKKYKLVGGSKMIFKKRRSFNEEKVKKQF